MTVPAPTNTGLIGADKLVTEIERYLAAVELFRAEGYEPRWDDPQRKGEWTPLGCRLAVLYEA